jgi:hypothetical protein
MAFTAVIVVLAVLVVVVTAVGFTPRPFSSNGESALGKAENSLGSQYTLDAMQLTAKWTFTSHAQVVLRFAGGDVWLYGQPLEAGCYSGTITAGAVLQFQDTRGVSFAVPASDATCQPVPAPALPS